MNASEVNDTNRAHSPIEAEVDATFAQWIGESSVYWNDERDAWIVTGYAEVAKILESADTFWRDIPEREGSHEFWGRHLLILEGRDHRRMHSFHMQLTGESFSEDIRGKAHDISREVSSRLVKQGRAELAADFADTIPFLIGCSFLGIDASDKTLIDTLLPQMKIRAKWKEALHAGSGIPLESKVAQDGQAALGVMAGVLLPIILDRRDHPRDDLISVMWEKGPSVFPDWNEHDVLSTCWSSLDNETKPLLRGLAYTLCRDTELQAKLRDDPTRVPGFVEEGLRFLTPFRTMRRVVKKDVELGGRKMHAGDSIYLITPLANRDEERWKCPHAFDAERSQDSTHFAFGYGPGYCVGRYVGRVEATEAINALLAETSMLRLDPDGAKPVWAGEMYHSVWPVHAILEASLRINR
jgi:cytochrome P450